MKLEIILLLCALLIAILAIIPLIVHILKMKKLDKEMNHWKKILQEEYEPHTDIIKNPLTRIYKMSIKNQEYVKVYDKLCLMNDKYGNDMSTAQSYVYQYFIIGTNSKVEKRRKKEYFEISLKIKKIFKEIRKTRNMIDALIATTLEQSKIIKEEYVRWGSNFRLSIRVYKEKRFYLELLQIQLDEQISDIKSKKRDIDEVLNMADDAKMAKLVNEYGILVKKFVLDLNLAIGLKSYIFSSIPNAMKQLSDYYEKETKKHKTHLQEINFSEIIKNLHKNYKKVKEYYFGMELESAKVLIQEIIRSIKIAEKMVNYEMKVKLFFASIYKDIKKYTYEIYDMSQSLTKDIENLVDRGIQLNIELQNEFSSLIQHKKILIEHSKEFSESIKNKGMIYSAKIQRAKRLLISNEQLVKQINITKKALWLLNMGKVILSNQFKQGNLALDRVISKTKKLGIQLDNNDEDIYEKLINQRSDIEKFMIDKNVRANNDLQMKIKVYIKDVSKFYAIVSGKIQMANITTNLLKQLSHIRAMNKNIHSSLSYVEKQFMEIDYKGALNSIISVLSKEGVK